MYIRDHIPGDPDMTASNAMSDVVTTLALAHYLFDDVQRSVQRARLLEAWFRTDTGGYMNPNVRSSQASPTAAWAAAS